MARTEELQMHLEFGNSENPLETGASIYVLIDGNIQPYEENVASGIDLVDSLELDEFINGQMGDPFFANNLDFIEWDPGVASGFNYDYAAVFHVK